jgi:hypothetical protein
MERIRCSNELRSQFTLMEHSFEIYWTFKVMKNDSGTVEFEQKLYQNSREPMEQEEKYRESFILHGKTTYHDVESWTKTLGAPFHSGMEALCDGEQNSCPVYAVSTIIFKPTFMNQSPTIRFRGWRNQPLMGNAWVELTDKTANSARILGIYVFDQSDLYPMPDWPIDYWQHVRNEDGIFIYPDWDSSHEYQLIMKARSLIRTDPEIQTGDAYIGSDIAFNNAPCEEPVEPSNLRIVYS